jgi:hypothetical protein
MTILPDDRVGTAIITADGTVLRTLEIPDPKLNLVCTVWSPDDARLACEGWDDSDASRGGIYTVSPVDGSDLRRLTEPPSGMAYLPGDVSADGHLVFKRYAGEEAPGPLWLVPMTDGEASPLSAASYGDPGQFDPDGQLVATAGSGQLAILDRQGAVVHQPEHGPRF